jgi:hypothetical protein
VTAFSGGLLVGGSGVWIYDAPEGLRAIVAGGTVIEVSQGDVRTVSSDANNVFFTGAAGTEDGRRVGLNDEGQLAFVSVFTDGSKGVFVATFAEGAAAVPEPGTLALLLGGLAVLGPVAPRSRRRPPA